MRKKLRKNPPVHRDQSRRMCRQESALFVRSHIHDPDTGLLPYVAASKARSFLGPQPLVQDESGHPMHREIG